MDKMISVVIAKRRWGGKTICALSWSAHRPVTQDMNKNIAALKVVRRVYSDPNHEKPHQRQKTIGIASR